MDWAGGLGGCMGGGGWMGQGRTGWIGWVDGNMLISVASLSGSERSE